ncbi:uncharacterized protein K441DRAFT_680106 [Cenococcum geophilum 1.58]|uniref:uncharacterized protein n=1 Tax=Cenococcum geophilum 1.58 TaxID=794803 RepID=UPI00358E9CDC|nr:hypothetical protein K441DRAFT_680106 [Cenococcum geophilum 1.58]
MSHILQDITKKTRNVTVILDCCYASRICRDLRHKDKARPKSLLNLQHHNILLNYADKLRMEGQLNREIFIKGNPYAIRIAAAATTETAWEYENLKGQPIGALTESLASAIKKTYSQKVSWRTVLLRVSESVNIEFPQQHPRVEGPDKRILFSIKTAAVKKAIIYTKRLAQAQHLLKLESGTGDKKLNHKVDIKFGVVRDGQRNPLPLPENRQASVTEKERVYISLRSNDTSTVFVSVFDVNVARKVTLVLTSSPKGIELGPSQPISKREHVEERLIFLISSSEVDLQHLAKPLLPCPEIRGDISSLERLIYQFAYSKDRDIARNT